MYCTILENIYAKEGHFITIEQALERIKSGKSRAKIEQIRAAIDKEKANDLKKQLPSVCFSGKFESRFDKKIIEHSGFLILDFDNVAEIDVLAATLANKPFIYSFWVSPSGNGLKALIRLADSKKHREHFNALKEEFPEVDNSGVNESRVCYESYDPNLYINTSASVYTKVLIKQKVEQKEVVQDEKLIFQRLVKWMANKNKAFVKGERNIFIFNIASACCRFGVNQQSAEYMIMSEYPCTNEFTTKEATNTIKSAYRSNKGGSAVFENEILVDRVTRKEIKIEEQIIDLDEPTRDVIYGATVKPNALQLFNNGYESVNGIGAQKLDELFKAKKGELTCMTGIGNYGKSTFYKWYILLRVVLFGEKFASFSPEDNPPEEYYHDFVEMLLGCSCIPHNPDGTVNFSQPKIEYYSNAYDFISNHIFYLYPKDSAPTPEYTKERFLELIIKEKIDGAAIDPFNQMSHEYGGRSDKYLEAVFGDYARFAQLNNIYLFIIAHPHKLQKQADGNYPCPDVFDLADGAMWNNKMDNIIVYHRPFMQTDPSNPTCEFHSKKIRRQKTVGKKGFINLEYIRKTRRYEVDGHDPLGEALRKNEMSFNKPIINYKPVPFGKSKEMPLTPSAGMQQSIADNYANSNNYNRKDWD